MIAVAAQVRADPGAVLKLRCLFLKLRSLLEVPLLRMGQARSPGLAPTTRVYSSALVAFSRRLLQVPSRSVRSPSSSNSLPDQNSGLCKLIIWATRGMLFACEGY